MLIISWKYFEKYVTVVTTRIVYRNICTLTGSATKAKKVNDRSKKVKVEIIGRKHSMYGIGRNKHKQFKTNVYTLCFPIVEHVQQQVHEHCSHQCIYVSNN